MQKSLFKVRYVDIQNSISLTNYADTIIYEKTSDEGRKNMLSAIRFGGYPEQVEAMSNAIYGGGSVFLETGSGTMILYGFEKKYNRSISHDGVYAEATLIALDDYEQSNEKKGARGDNSGKEEIEQTEFTDCPPRKCYIYVKTGDEEALFNAIDSKTAVPLIPEFSDYLLKELMDRGILVKLEIMAVTAGMEGWLLKCEDGDANIVSVVEDGLQNGCISIPCAGPNSDNALDEVSSVTSYLTQFGPAIAERIKNLFVPLFDPEKEQLSPEVLEINKCIQEHAGYSLYNAQLAVAEAIKRQLERRKVGLIIAECGAGKSKIGVTAIAPVVAGLRLNQHGRGPKKTFNIVLCPSHICQKWVREIEESLPDTFAGIVSTPTDFDRLYEEYAKIDKSCYAIISKESARDGYMRAPAAVWNRRRGAFLCPDCNGIIEMVISDDGSKYVVEADQFFFMRENRDNHKCKHCGASLWTALNPNAAHGHEWIKVGGYGFVYRKHADAHLEKVKSADAENKICEVIGGTFQMRMVLRKYPLSTYIKKHYKGRIDGFIADELHLYNNDSGQGDAMAELYGAAKKVIGMTATLINGYSSGIFYLLYRIVPHLMQMDDKAYHGISDFITEYGVVQNIHEEVEAEYNANRRSSKRKKSTRQLPGVSPLVYSRFLLEYAAFLSLTDMGKDLPEYEEIPIALSAPDDVMANYNKMQTTLTSYLKQDRKMAQKILSAYMNLLTAYPDQPYGQPPVLHPVDGSPIVEPPDVGDISTLMPKDEKTLEIVKMKIASGERVLIYTNWIRLDTQKKLHKLLQEEGYAAEILHAKVQPKKREQWVEDRLAEGLQVLIANPSLLETGLDLNAFTTIIYYDTGSKLFTLRQASRRSWRINQTAPRVEVYMLFYMDTLQHKAMKLMGTKLAVAAIIEGGFSEEGLAAMSQCEDMTTIMAKELMLGIKDNVEDVSAAFKKMAFLKPTETQNTLVTFDALHNVISLPNEGVQYERLEFSLLPLVSENKIIQLPAAPKSVGKNEVETVAVGQMSLFGQIA